MQQGSEVSVKGLDTIMALLVEKKRKMEQDEAERNLQMLLDFLHCLRKQKVDELSEIQADLQFIKEDIGAVEQHRRVISLLPVEELDLFDQIHGCTKIIRIALVNMFIRKCYPLPLRACYRYSLILKMSDASGEGWVSAFNEQTERVIGCSAEDLDKLRSQDGEENLYQLKLKETGFITISE